MTETFHPTLYRQNGHLFQDLWAAVHILQAEVTEGFYLRKLKLACRPNKLFSWLDIFRQEFCHEG